MLSDTIRILNFDNTVSEQKTLVERYHPVIVDLSSLGPSVRMWGNRANANKVRAALNPGFKNAVTFLGSGDFHHISALLTEQFDEDFCVVIFDFHPDLDYLPPRFSCGSWVNLIAAQKTINKIALLGPSSEDLSFPHNMTFNFSWFNDARVELYPFFHAPSMMLGKNLHENHFIHPEPRGIFQRITWENLRDRNIKEAITEIVRRLPTRNIYISIDKDCLNWSHAVTNWEPGIMGLDWLLEALRIFKDNKTIIGMDIVGDYSPVKSDSRIKAFCSDKDHPRQLARDLDFDKITGINEATNLRILESVLS